MQETTCVSRNNLWKGIWIKWETQRKQGYFMDSKVVSSISGWMAWLFFSSSLKSKIFFWMLATLFEVLLILIIKISYLKQQKVCRSLCSLYAVKLILNLMANLYSFGRKYLIYFSHFLSNSTSYLGCYFWMIKHECFLYLWLGPNVENTLTGSWILMMSNLTKISCSHVNAIIPGRPFISAIFVWDNL